MKTKLDFTVVVPAAQAGDKAAQDALMANFYEWSVREARRWGAEEETARNIAVEFWARMLRTDPPGLCSYDSTKGNLFPWLQTVIRNETMDALRGGRTQVYYWQLGDPEDWGPDPDSGVLEFDSPLEEAAAAESRGRVLRVLTPRGERVFKMLEEGMTAEEIAAKEGSTVRAVRYWIADVRATARLVLDD